MSHQYWAQPAHMDTLWDVPSVTTHNFSCSDTAQACREVCVTITMTGIQTFSDLVTAFFEGFQGFIPCSDLCMSLCSLNLLLHHMHLHSQGKNLNCTVFAELKFQNTEHHCSCSNRLPTMERSAMDNYQK